MSAELVTPDPAPQPLPSHSARPRLWIPITLILLYWGYVGVSTLIEMPMFHRFMSQTAVLLLVMLVFLIWWSFNRRIKGWDRIVALGAAIVSPVVAQLISHQTMGPFPVMSGLPILLTAWALWLVVAQKAPPRVWNVGLIAVLFLSTAVFGLFRMEGLKGGGLADLRWRWSQSAEEKYLAERSAGARSATTQASAVVLRAGDWPGFRGANRDSVVRAVSIATDWANSPPRQIWRRAIGPGWSSMIVVDGRVFTQEQRGDDEAVVCLDAANGSEIWSHEEPQRFWDALSSAGPRATPTFDGGRIYAQGAMGTLLCLDAASGTKVWSKNVLADAGAKVPDWGVSSSPLVTNGVVVVFAGGQGGKSLLAYRAGSGEIAWAVDAGGISYSSAQLVRMGGREQILFIGDKGMVSADPESGKKLWEYANAAQPPRSLQPMPVSETQVLVPMGMEVATDLIEVAPSGAGFNVSKRWTSRNLKPSFNDFVVHEGHVYGFDGSMFCCVELKTGQRKWRKGRYGTGQVLLLAEQGVLVVISDQGKVVLVRAKTDGLEEAGEFQAIHGKTWNHPVLAHGRLYVRNAQEIACYSLKE